MKLSVCILSAIAVFACGTHRAHGQWSLNGAKAYYNSGNVGIGTSNPNHALDVRSAGNRAIFGVATADTGATHGIYGQSTSGAGRGVFGIASKSSGTNFGVYGKTNSSNGYAGYFEGGRNYMQGRLGLGRKNPAQKLDVNGNVRVNGWIGTPVNTPLVFRAGNVPILRMQQAAGFSNEQTANMIGGYQMNAAAAGVGGATISGGGRLMSDQTSLPNLVQAHYGTIGGGADHVVSGTYGAIGGGFSSQVAGSGATVSGGMLNWANGDYSAVSGGWANSAGGHNAMVPGGDNCTASGNHSFAAGRQAKANHLGAFVWGDSTASNVASTAANQFIVRASGGIWLGTTSAPSIPAGRFLNTSTGGYLTTGGTWTNASSRELKHNFEAVNAREVLQRVASLPILKWNYKAEGDNITHLGPIAEDFAAAFGLGDSSASIATVDADGVALAAIQGLHQIVIEKNAEIADLQRRLASIEAKMAEIAGMTRPEGMHVEASD